MTRKQATLGLGEVNEPFQRDGDFLKPLVWGVIQELVANEMGEHLAVERREHTDDRGQTGWSDLTHRLGTQATPALALEVQGADGTTLASRRGPGSSAGADGSAATVPGVGLRLRPPAVQEIRLCVGS